MNNKIKLTQVVNAGLLIETMGKKILIDGIHTEKTHEWSTVDEKLAEHMIYGDGKYKNIDIILYTHQHVDHFNKEKTLEYMDNNKVEKLIMSDPGDIDSKYKGQLVSLTSGYFEVSTIELDKFNIKYFKTRHLEEKKYGIEHYSYIINIGNKSILYIGDADFSLEELITPLKDYKIDILVAPFLVVNSNSGRIFVRKVDPALLIVNHLPSQDDDEYNFRSVVEKDIQKHISEMPQTVIFQNTGDNLIL
jgi:L-ascorbate metabolism protein UlaG (beta-lactamase superfamily)